MLREPERVQLPCFTAVNFMTDGWKRGELERRNQSCLDHKWEATVFLNLQRTGKASRKPAWFRMLAPGLAGVHASSFGVSEEAHMCVFRYEHWRDCDRPREAAEIQATSGYITGLASENQRRLEPERSVFYR